MYSIDRQILMNSIEQLRKWCNGSWSSHYDEAKIIETLVIDSRSISNPNAAMFIALKTKLRDGHSFLKEAYHKGIRNFLVSQEIDAGQYPDTNIIKVKDTLTALQQIAAAHRQQFHIPVIGITGSNGKTIIKEWLYQLLCDNYTIVRSPRSYNSQVGVPLSVWQISAAHTLALFEAGISEPGEMERLEPIISPDIGIFTNIGEAHSEGFVNVQQKIREKLFLFRHSQTIIYCADQTIVHENLQQFLQQIKGTVTQPHSRLFSWSYQHDADLHITKVMKLQNKTTITANYQEKEIEITIPFIDSASIENVIHCWCTLLILGMGEYDIKSRMLLLHPVSMRLELRHGINDCTIINDTYNSDLTSLQTALNYLDQQKQHQLHTVILSDMLQMGKHDVDLYQEVADMMSKNKIQRFIGIGEAVYKNKAIFRKYKKTKSIFFKSTDDFLKKFHTLNFSNEAILLKGARVFAFEKIALLLEQQIHQTVMTIDLSALRHNLNVFRSELAAGVKTMAMVKAFAYGSGSYEIASLLQYSGVDYLAVAYTEEGISLRKTGITMPIMVMSPDASSFNRMIAWKLEPEIYNFKSLATFIHIARTLNLKEYPVHIKLDTGMHRLGFGKDDIGSLGMQVKTAIEIKVASIFSHLAASDDVAEDEYTMRQAHLFDTMSYELIEQLKYRPLRHLCNSAAIARLHDLHYNMVRIGVGLYGIDTSHALTGKLKQISTLKTVIAQITDVKKGENIGYGHHTIALEDMRIATICIGYADGYPRSLGNGNAYVLIHGKQATITGSICMDMCMVDITNIPEAKEGDEVIVFDEQLPVSQLASWAGTIPYEIMTGISQRVKRIYINE